jgi:hypothetical protein
MTKVGTKRELYEDGGPQSQVLNKRFRLSWQLPLAMDRTISERLTTYFHLTGLSGQTAEFQPGTEQISHVALLPRRESEGGTTEMFQQFINVSTAKGMLCLMGTFREEA